MQTVLDAQSCVAGPWVYRLKIAKHCVVVGHAVFRWLFFLKHTAWTVRFDLTCKSLSVAKDLDVVSPLLCGCFLFILGKNAFSFWWSNDSKYKSTWRLNELTRRVFLLLKLNFLMELSLWNFKVLFEAQVKRKVIFILHFASYVGWTFIIQRFY